MGSLYLSLESGFLCASQVAPCIIGSSVHYSLSRRSECLSSKHLNTLSLLRYLSLPESGGKDKTMMNMMTDVTGVTRETRETQVTGAAKVTGERQVAASTPIDRSNERLIDNNTSFNALLRILATNPEVLVNAKAEAEEREAEEKEEKLRRTYGADYDLVFDHKAKEKANSMAGNNKCRRPGAIQLRNNVPRIAMIRIGENGICEVFSNGYAVYDNGNRKVVIWVPDCGTAKYYFATETDEITPEVMGEFPWFNAVLIAGEDRIQYNMDHPKSQVSASDFDFDDAKPAASWAGATRFPNPEDEYIRKEAAEERRKALTEKQRRAYVMKYENGMSLEEIGEIEGISFGTVRDRLDCAKKKFATDLEKFFS